MTGQDNLEEKLAEGSLMSHLLELRERLMRALVSVFLFFVPLAFFRNQLFTFLATPLIDKLPKGASLISTSLTAPFLEPVKLAFYVALFLAMPYILYQVWAFVSPGLYKREKRFAMPLLMSSIALFYAGVAFAYYLIFPLSFAFLTTVGPQGVAMMTDISSYLSFTMKLFLAFGLAFEIPVAIVLLVWTGLVNIQTLANNRGYALLVISIIAAVLAPPDALSMCLMGAPMYLLYELGIIFARFLLKEKLAERAKQEKEQEAG
jgi:sec-independent protein translocase protein TatC